MPFRLDGMDNSDRLLMTRSLDIGIPIIAVNGVESGVPPRRASRAAFIAKPRWESSLAQITSPHASEKYFYEYIYQWSCVLRKTV